MKMRVIQRVMRGVTVRSSACTALVSPSSGSSTPSSGEVLGTLNALPALG